MFEVCSDRSPIARLLMSMGAWSIMKTNHIINYHFKTADVIGKAKTTGPAPFCPNGTNGDGQENNRKDNG